MKVFSFTRQYIHLLTRNSIFVLQGEGYTESTSQVVHLRNEGKWATTTLGVEIGGSWKGSLGKRLNGWDRRRVRSGRQAGTDAVVTVGRENVWSRARMGT